MTSGRSVAVVQLLCRKSHIQTLLVADKTVSLEFVRAAHGNVGLSRPFVTTQLIRLPKFVVHATVRSRD